MSVDRQQLVEQRLSFIARAWRREGRIGRQPKEVVGVDMATAETGGKPRRQCRRARARSAEDVEAGYSAACALVGAIAFMVPP
jgi:hypothetical protein